MWLAYVDESLNAHRHYVTALLISEDRVNAAQRALRELAQDAEDTYDLPRTPELHGYDVFHGENDLIDMKKLVRARVALYRDALQILVGADCWVILRGVNKPGLVARYPLPDHPHRVTMAHLIERIDGFCNSKGDGVNALIVADEHHETQSVLLRDLITYQDSGTWGYLAKKITRVVDTIHFVNSKTNALVQGADLVSFLAFRWINHTETDARAEKAMAELWGIIEPRIHHQWCWHP